MVFHWTPVSAMSVAASQPQPKSNVSTISPTRPFSLLCAVKMIYLSSLSDFNPHPSRGMFTYLITDFYFHNSYLEKQQSIFTQTISKQSQPQLQLAYAPTGDIGTHRYLQTHTHADTFVLSALFWQTCRCLGPTGDIMVVGKMSSHQMATVWCHHGSYL